MPPSLLRNSASPTISLIFTLRSGFSRLFAAAASAASGASSGATLSAAASTRAALPDGVRLSLQFGPGSGGINGTLVRDLQLVHP